MINATWTIGTNSIILFLWLTSTIIVKEKHSRELYFRGTIIYRNDIFSALYYHGEKENIWKNIAANYDLRYNIYGTTNNVCLFYGTFIN